jgi:hypothetical protein
MRTGCPRGGRLSDLAAGLFGLDHGLAVVFDRCSDVDAELGLHDGGGRLIACHG